jgi:hypothetical protein
MSRILTAVAVLALATSPVLAYSGGCRMASNTTRDASPDPAPGGSPGTVTALKIVDVPVTGSIEPASDRSAAPSRSCGEVPRQSE